MRYLSLFSGIEAASVAWAPLGWECVGVAEIDPFPCAVLRHHYPTVPNLGNISAIREEQVQALGRIDLVVGGFPCQDLSVAGKRKGLRNDDGSVTRSGLFFDAMRVVRWAAPRWLLVENVPGLYSSNDGRDFAEVVGDILGVSFDVPPGGWENAGVAASDAGLLEWATLDAQFFALAQRRQRVFALADFGDWHGRPPVLLERESLSGHPAPRREAGQVAPTVPARRTGGGGLGTDFDCDGGLIAADVAPTLNAHFGSKQGLENQHIDGGCGLFVAHSLRADGFDASEDGTGRGTPLVPIPFDTTQITSAANYSNPKPGDPCHPLAAGAHAPAIAHAFDARQSDVIQYGDQAGPLDTDGHSIAVAFDVFNQHIDGDIAHTLRVATDNGYQSTPHVLSPHMAVRRLTPKECCRLQGFKDDYLDILYRGKPAADGPKYKALGNSMAVPVMRWIGQRIQMVEDLLREAVA